MPPSNAREHDSASVTYAPTSERAQLFQLSSVLNGLESGASAMRKQALQVMWMVRQGSYHVDPAQLSSRIIGDAMSRRSDAA